MKVDRDAFFKAQSKLEVVPFEQAEGWNAYKVSDPSGADYFVDDLENPNIAVWGRRFKIPFIGGTILKIECESLNSAIDEDKLAQFYSEIFEQGYALVILSSIEPYNVKYEVGVRKAGYLRPLGAVACPLSVAVDMNAPELRHKSWRKRCRKAEQAGVVFKHIANPTREDVGIFAKIYNDMSDFKNMGHPTNADELFNLFKDERFRLYFAYAPDGQPISGSIRFWHKKRAQGVFTANSLLAREYSSSYFLHENCFRDLQSLGVETFDFSRIAPGLGSASSVGDFKLYSGGTIFEYAGEWVRAKNKWVELFYRLYRVYFKHGTRY